MRAAPVLALLLAVAPLAAFDMAAAADCRAAASRAAQQSGGRVLSARPVNGGAECEVTLLVPQDGGPPRRVVTRVTAAASFDRHFGAPFGSPFLPAASRSFVPWTTR